MRRFEGWREAGSGEAAYAIGATVEITFAFVFVLDKEEDEEEDEGEDEEEEEEEVPDVPLSEGRAVRCGLGRALMSVGSILCFFFAFAGACAAAPALVFPAGGAPMAGLISVGTMRRRFFMLMARWLDIIIPYISTRVLYSTLSKGHLAEFHFFSTFRPWTATSPRRRKRNRCQV